MTEIFVTAYPGAIPQVCRDNGKGERIVCHLCGQKWMIGLCVNLKDVCGPCYVKWPYNVNPDIIPPGMEMAGTGI